MAVQNGVDDEVLGDAYPFGDHAVELSTGHQMHYIRMGRAGFRRPTFLLLHGFPTWSALWRRFMAPLARIGQVVAVDHVGFGRSDHPTDPAYHTLDRHVRNLEELAHRLRLRRVVPVMHGWGGPIGFGYAVRHPKDVAGLVGLATWGAPDTPPEAGIAARVRFGPGVGEALHVRRNGAVERLLPRMSRDGLDRQAMDLYRHPFPNRSSRTALLAWPRMVPDRPSHPDWPTMEAIGEGLSMLDAPAITVWGIHDRAFGERQADSLDRRLANAEPPQWVESGHLLPEDAPQETLAVIERFAEKRL